MEKPTRNKILIFSTIVLTFGLSWIGWKYWGWFSTDEHSSTEGFPKNPKDGDKFTKDGKVYVFKKMEINCIMAPCPDGLWIIFNAGDSPDGRESFAVGGKVPIQVSICNKTKIEIQKDGSKIFYKINNVIFQWGQYWEVYIASGYPNSLYKITQQEYMNYINKCIA